MTINTLCDNLEIYALDALPEAEMIEFDEHLATCPSCAAALPALHESAAELAMLLPLVKAPARLKMNILSLATDTPREEMKEETAAPESSSNVVQLRRASKIIKMTTAVATVAAAFVMGTLITVQNNELSKTPVINNPQIETVSTVLDQVRSSKDAAVINKKLSSGGEVAVNYSRSINKAVFSASDLKTLEPKKVYQLWLQNDSGEMIPAGLIVDSKSSILLMKGNLLRSKAIGITVEKEGGATSPTTVPIALITI